MLVLKGYKDNDEKVMLSDNAEKIYYEIGADSFYPCCGQLCVEDYHNTEEELSANCLGCFFHNKKHNLCICKEFLKGVSEMD